MPTLKKPIKKPRKKRQVKEIAKVEPPKVITKVEADDVFDAIINKINELNLQYGISVRIRNVILYYVIYALGVVITIYMNKDDIYNTTVDFYKYALRNAMQQIPIENLQR
jgi:hypothetical protein